MSACPTMSKKANSFQQRGVLICVGVAGGRTRGRFCRCCCFAVVTCAAWQQSPWKREAGRKGRRRRRSGECAKGDRKQLRGCAHIHANAAHVLVLSVMEKREALSALQGLRAWTIEKAIILRTSGCYKDHLLRSKRKKCYEVNGVKVADTNNYIVVS